MQQDVSAHNIWILFETIAISIPYPRWNSGACSLSMVIGWTLLMQDEGADVVTK